MGAYPYTYIALDGWPVGERKQAVIKWGYVLEFQSYSVNLDVGI
jgi:hypothetical protein